MGKIKHGDTNKRLYKIWCHMRERCNSSNKDKEAYKNYSGRGISVCEEWNNYNTFKEWAISHDYKDNLSIDRKDVNGNYEPSNCRWATMKEQQNNRRNNTLINFKGETKTLKQWSEKYNINCVSLLSRISREWSFEDALTTPIGESEKNQENYHLITYKGITKTVTEWAQYYNMSVTTLFGRINEANWSIEKALTTLVGESAGNSNLITYNGKTKNLLEWSEEYNISHSTLITRINRGWPIEKALTTPIKELKKDRTYNGQTKNLLEWAKEYNIDYNTLRNRINHLKWSLEKALTTPVKKHS